MRKKIIIALLVLVALVGLGFGDSIRLKKLSNRQVLVFRDDTITTHISNNSEEKTTQHSKSMPEKITLRLNRTKDFQTMEIYNKTEYYDIVELQEKKYYYFWTISTTGSDESIGYTKNETSETKVKYVKRSKLVQVSHSLKIDYEFEYIDHSKYLEISDTLRDLDNGEYLALNNDHAYLLRYYPKNYIIINQIKNNDNSEGILNLIHGLTSTDDFFVSLIYADVLSVRSKKSLGLDKVEAKK